MGEMKNGNQQKVVKQEAGKPADKGVKPVIAATPAFT